MASFTNEQKYELITRNLQEVIGGDKIKDIIAKGETVKAYWGTAPTGRPHIAYFVPLAKIADFLLAGVNVKILLADIHAFLDSQKAPLDLVGHRVDYYRRLLYAVFNAIGVPTDKLEFVVGSSYQLKSDYTMDVYRLSSMATDHDAKRAGAEVVKQSATAPLSSLLYPGLQALDEQYLDVDFQFGGADQRKIFIYAEEFLPKLGYAKRSHLMNPIVPGLVKGGKMSSSDPKSKIDFLDSAADVKKKINNAFCEEGNIEENGLLAFFKAVAIPISQLKSRVSDGKSNPFVGEGAPEGTVISIFRDEKFGGDLHYSSFKEMETSFAEKKLHPKDLKKGMTDTVNNLLQPIRDAFESDEDFKKSEANAYPVQAPPEKKTKIKNRGTGAPGGQKAKAPESAPEPAAAADTTTEAAAPAVASVDSLAAGTGALEITPQTQL
ncbi:tyrosine trna ligase [Phaffia rhodozyma]|uniref:Tyrosine--tRNA ligase n=1 Tax=Phaffia rhodozyma TaxID=264483 RepID=A0A0F7SRF6_PHARH|nr:tyrosine trna ligase [Phaffia rhodozyma]